MRDLTTLYTILYTRCKRKYSYKGASFLICNSILDLKTRMHITHDEFVLLLSDFEDNKPTDKLHHTFYNHPLYIRREKVAGWFKTIGYAEESTELRLDFIAYLAVYNYYKIK